MRTVSADWVVPVESDPIRHGAVAIGDDGTIAAVGPASELGQGDHHDGCVILPGFVNAHSHLEYAVYAGFGDGLPFVPWIGLHVQRKDALDFADMTAIATVGAFESLRSGITTTGDCSFSGAAALAAALTGLRALVYLEVFSSDVAPLDRFHESRGRIEHVLSERVRLGVSPHAPYTCTLDDYRACAALGVPQATHLAESAAEREWLVGGAGDWSPLARFLVPPPGETGIRLLAGAGLLGPGLMAAHCVDVDDDEIELLARAGVGVAHCPRSNGYLGCGVAPVAELRDAGIPVAVATDSPASAPSFDMFEEIRTAIVGARARARRPDALSADAALELATLGGARVLGMAAEVGSLVPGKQADLTILSLAGTPVDPVEDPVRAAVLGGSPDRVTATLVAGEQRYSKRNIVARFDKSSTKRPKQDAAVAASRGSRRSTAPSIEDTMFFPRLRRHAKWMFVFLAVALGGGFVLFGVGAGGTGVGDLFRGSSSSGVPSISSAEKRTREEPKNVEAWRDLSTALQTDGQTDRAIAAQNQVVVLAPKDGDALRELASLHIAQAAAKQREAQALQVRAAYQGAGQSFPGTLVSSNGLPLVDDKISTTINAESTTQIQALSAAAQSAAAAAVATYKRLVALSPTDPNVQLELAQAAQQAGDYPTAISAYTRFLRLAPDDPSASIVKQQLKQLKQAAASSG